MKENERLMAGWSTPEDSETEKGLRPRTLNEYIGQSKIKESLKIMMQAAKARKEPLEHLLFYGPPGLGKTTLAYIIANEMKVDIRVTSGPVIERAGDLAALLTNLSPNDVLFIDEIHRLNHTVEEILYPAMEDGVVDIMTGKGPGARSLRLNLSPFTLIGATTRAGMITGPLRERFGMTHRIDFYDVEEIKQIIFRSAKLLKVEVEEQGVLEIARRSRGTPRVANRLLKRVRDWAQVKAKGVVTLDAAKKALSMLEVDDLGLDAMDRRLLLTLIEKFKGGPVGLDSLAVALSEESETLEDVYEPFLIQIGFLQRTASGRRATDLAYKHFGKTASKQSQEKLF